ncbi:MAG: T9SS type A sorting domain-containing protein [Bacteroidetes bacterium]|nr:T9SS type A sorting domain-containing protein [Bacteroidota bacterium]
MRQKKIHIALFILGMAGASEAQTLEKNDIKPQFHAKYAGLRIENPLLTDPGDSGKNVVWDFTNWQTNTGKGYLYTLLTPDECPIKTTGTAWVLQTYPMDDSLSITYDFYAETADSYYRIKEYTDLWTINYPTPEKVYLFPLQYGKTNASSSSYRFNMDNQTWDYSAKSSLVIDGMGLLKTQYGNFDNILRIKYSSEDWATGGTDTGHSVKYIWYKAGTAHPLAEYSIYTDPKGTVIRFGVIYVEMNTLFAKHDENPQIKFYPNPASTKLHFECENLISKYCIKDIRGKIIQAEIQLSDRSLNLDVSQLESGMYLLEYATTGKEKAVPFVVAR